MFRTTTIGALLTVGLCCAGAAGAQPTLERTSCLLPTAATASDGLGAKLAAADWDDDGDSDLAYGGPHLDAFGHSNAGVFRAYRFDAAEDEWTFWVGLAGGSSFLRGFAVVAGDFDGDGVDEFAFSSPFDGGGSVLVREATGDDSSSTLGIELRQGSASIAGVEEVVDAFGLALAVGDFDGDGFADLAVGVPGEAWSGVTGTDHGAVQVFYGTAAGLDGARDVLFGQHSFASQTREAGDRFGEALAVGDFDGDGYDDLAIGVPKEDEGEIIQSGIVHVVYGGSTGLDFTRRQNWAQSTSGIAGSPEPFDAFGSALAAGNFDSDAGNRDDLAIAADCEDDGALNCAGAIHVLYAGAGGLAAAGSDLLLRPGGSLAQAAFGIELLAADLDGDGTEDLVAATDVESNLPPLGPEASGEAHLFYGDPAVGLRASGLGPWRPEAGACLDLAVEAFDFGGALAAGDFDGDGRADLAIGIAGWTDDSELAFKGAVQVHFGSDALFRDGFETGDPGRWSDRLP